MKRLVIPSLLSLILVSCGSNQAENPEPPTTESTAEDTTEPETDASESESSPSPTTEPLQVDEFTLDELDGAGCGMTLWRPDRPSNDLYVLFSGLNPGSMEMKIDGEMLKFDRVEGSGEEFYGQQTTQTFENADEDMTVNVNVTLGEEGEIESIAIDEGRMEVTQGEQRLVFPVVGNAGC